MMSAMWESRKVNRQAVSSYIYCAYHMPGTTLSTKIRQYRSQSVAAQSDKCHVEVSMEAMRS